MSDPQLDDVVFDTINGLTCEEFVRLTRRSALRQERYDDDRWTALYAASCLGGPAAIWYEKLSEETQESWKLLRQALFLDFSPSIDELPMSPVSEHFSNDQTVPTPAAAAAPPTPSAIKQDPRPSGGVQKGFIKILGASKIFLGYVADSLSSKGHAKATSSVDEALIVEFSSSKRLHACVIVEPSRAPTKSNKEERRLGITWGYKTSNPEPLSKSLLKGGGSWGGLVFLTRAHPSAPFKSSSTHFTGHSGHWVWRILFDGTMLIGWDLKPHVQFQLDFVFSKARGVLYFATDYEAHTRNEAWAYERVQLIFEQAPSAAASES